MNEPAAGQPLAPLLLSVEQAAEMLGIARTSMYRLIGTGEVESVQVGRLRRIPMACLEEFIERLRASTHRDT